MKQSTVDFCFANLAAFKSRPSPDQDLSVTCGGPAPPPSVLSSLLQPGPRTEKNDHQRRKKLFMNSLSRRPLGSMKTHTMTSSAPSPSTLTPTSLVTRLHSPSASCLRLVEQWHQPAQTLAAPRGHSAHQRLLGFTRCCQPRAWHCGAAWQLDPQEGRAKPRHGHGAWWLGSSIPPGM